MKSVFNLLKITDRYERKARLLPALISCLVAAPGLAAVFSLGVPNLDIRVFLSGGTAVAIAAVIAVGLSYGASMAGRRYEKKLWPCWPHDAPTNVWLSPEYSRISPEQKCIWYGAIKRLTQLDIGQTAIQGDEEALGRIINDAIVALRPQFRSFRQTDYGGLLAIHNEDYGFARNFAGLRVIWLPAGIISAIGSWSVYFLIGTWLGWGVFATLFLIVIVAVRLSLPAYVRQRADRYAESFFGVLMAIDNRNSKMKN